MHWMHAYMHALDNKNSLLISLKAQNSMETCAFFIRISEFFKVSVLLYYAY